ncbi:MAG: glycosyl hydrolase, partial [Vicinamibacterales bacterium]
PYHVCGAQQDGNTVCLPNETGGGGGRGGRGGAGAPEMYNPGGFEPGYIAPDPKDPDAFFAGSVNGGYLQYTNRRTGQQREVHPYPRMFSGEPSSSLVERIQWTFPIIFSPVDTRVLYTATQHVWRTTNNGQSWDRISGDLTRHDPKTMGFSGGPITKDMNGPEVYATVFALAPGKRDALVLWAGSDDGLIHVTRDGGKSWANVTPKDMPDFGRVSLIDASSFDAGTAYAAVKRPLLDDFAPYIFRTHDFGRTWTKVVNGISAEEYVNTVREDPKRKGLLYAGTFKGVYLSYDDGATWQSLSLNLPSLPVSDLIVEARDLVISTHGRGFYVLDDIAPIRQFIPAAAAASPAYLFAPEDAYRSTNGAQIKYWVTGPVTNLTIDIVDKAGTVVRSFAGAAGGGGGAAQGEGRGGGGGSGRGGGGGVANASMSPGMQSVAWDLRYPSAVSFPNMILWGGGVQGPAAAPGTYQVRMTVNGVTQTQPFQVRKHPMHLDVTDADLQEQFDLLIRIRDKTSEANQAVIDIRRIKADVADRVSKSTDTKLKTAADGLIANLSEVEGEIYQVKNQAGQDPLNFPIKVNNRLASLGSMVGSGDGKPIGNALPIFTALSSELKVLTDNVNRILTKELAVFNAEAARLKLEPVKGR